DRTDALGIALRGIHGTGIDQRAAITAEGVAAFVAAFGCLHITLWRAAAEDKMLGRRRDIYTERRAGERLAVGAVADGECSGIDLRFEGDLPAMAVSVDLHASFPLMYRGSGRG